jgi:hypothetical protein
MLSDHMAPVSLNDVHAIDTRITQRFEWRVDGNVPSPVEHPAFNERPNDSTRGTKPWTARTEMQHARFRDHITEQRGMAESATGFTVAAASTRPRALPIRNVEEAPLSDPFRDLFAPPR